MLKNVLWHFEKCQTAKLSWAWNIVVCPPIWGKTWFLCCLSAVCMLVSKSCPQHNLKSFQPNFVKFAHILVDPKRSLYFEIWGKGQDNIKLKWPWNTLVCILTSKVPTKLCLTFTDSSYGRYQVSITFCKGMRSKVKVTLSSNDRRKPLVCWSTLKVSYQTSSNFQILYMADSKVPLHFESIN